MTKLVFHRRPSFAHSAHFRLLLNPSLVYGREGGGRLVVPRDGNGGREGLLDIRPAGFAGQPVLFELDKAAVDNGGGLGVYGNAGCGGWGWGWGRGGAGKAQHRGWDLPFRLERIWIWSRIYLLLLLLLLLLPHRASRGKASEVSEYNTS